MAEPMASQAQGRYDWCMRTRSYIAAGLLMVLCAGICVAEDPVDDLLAQARGAYERGDATVTGALRALRDVAQAMTDALRAADLERVAALLTENWRRQQELDAGMRTDEMARLERAVIDAGALGGKAAGAGAGGSMFFVAGEDVAAVADAARAAGATVLPVRWAREGARAW